MGGLKMDGTPKGFIEIKTDGVFYNTKTNELVVCGMPSKKHNCDEMGCGSMDHVLIRVYLTTNILN